LEVETSHYMPFEEEKRGVETNLEWIERDPIKSADVR
jgi:hypothetical protein